MGFTLPGIFYVLKENELKVEWKFLKIEVNEIQKTKNKNNDNIPIGKHVTHAVICVW